MTRCVRLGAAVVAALTLVTCTGCPQYRDPTVPGEMRRLTEPLSGGEYYVYAPVTYDPAREYALIVVCHGTPGFDSARRQMGDWVKLAEEQQFIVAAPTLQGVNSLLPPPLPKQLERQRRDEEHILACVRQLQSAYRIARDKIFLTGWSAGGFAVLYTGLSNPDVFRAIAVLQGNFKAEYLGEVASRIDPYQPVYVLYGSDDVLTGRHGSRCAEWLTANGVAVTKEVVAGVHKNHPKQGYAFFERVVRKAPWLRIRALAENAAEPLTIRFDVWASFAPRRYTWSFGDGQTSPLAAPLHTYARSGRYTVTLDAETPGGKVVRRAVDLSLPNAAYPGG